MAEDPLSPRQPPKSLAERSDKHSTGMTGIAELSKQAAQATKDAVGKVADASKETKDAWVKWRCRKPAKR